MNAHLSFFESGYNCKMTLLQYLNRNVKPKFLYHQSWSRYQSASFNKWMTIYAELWGAKLLQVKLARNPQHHQTTSIQLKKRQIYTNILQSFFSCHIYCTTCATTDNEEAFMVQDAHIKFNSKLQISAHIRNNFI